MLGSDELPTTTRGSTRLGPLPGVLAVQGMPQKVHGLFRPREYRGPLPLAVRRGHGITERSPDNNLRPWLRQTGLPELPSALRLNTAICRNSSTRNMFCFLVPLPVHARVSLGPIRSARLRYLYEGAHQGRRASWATAAAAPLVYPSPFPASGLAGPEGDRGSQTHGPAGHRGRTTASRQLRSCPQSWTLYRSLRPLKSPFSPC